MTAPVCMLLSMLFVRFRETASAGLAGVQTRALAFEPLPDAATLFQQNFGSRVCYMVCYLVCFC